MLRRHAPDDVAALSRAIAESREHLLPWMAWAAHEPQSDVQRAQRISDWRASWDAATNFSMAMVDPADETRIIGGTGLHPRGGPRTIEIGYWVHADWVGRGVATEASQLLTTAALDLDAFDAVEICHDRANRASGAVPRKLGYRLVEEFAHSRDAPAHTGWFWRWRTP